MLWLILAIVLWGIFHSLLASARIKDLFRRAFGDGFMKFYRLFFNFYAMLSILPAVYLMLTQPDKPIYQVPAPYDYVMRVGQGASLFLLLVAVFQTDLLAFIGVRQVMDPKGKPRLVTTGLYHFMRHPLLVFTLSTFWFSPNMSVNFLIFCLGLTVYVLVGITFEERKLLREFGQEYEQYRAATPMLIPGLNFIWNK